MTPQSWKLLTPSHQADVWPTLTPQAQAAIIADDPEALRIIANATAEQIGTAKDASATKRSAVVAPRPIAQFVREQMAREGKPGSATCCYVLSSLSFVGGAVWILVGTEGDKTALYFGSATLASAVLWWALGDVVVYLHRLTNR